MIRRPPRSTRTDTLFPSTTLFRSAQPRLEIFIAETADFLQFVALAVPQPDRRQRDAVEAIGLDHRIMRLVEEGETLPDRSEERRVGKEWVSTFRSRCSR